MKKILVLFVAILAIITTASSQRSINLHKGDTLIVGETPITISSSEKPKKISQKKKSIQIPATSLYKDKEPLIIHYYEAAQHPQLDQVPVQQSVVRSEKSMSLLETLGWVALIILGFVGILIALLVLPKWLSGTVSPRNNPTHVSQIPSHQTFNIQGANSYSNAIVDGSESRTYDYSKTKREFGGRSYGLFEFNENGEIENWDQKTADSFEKFYKEILSKENQNQAQSQSKEQDQVQTK